MTRLVAVAVAVVLAVAVAAYSIAERDSTGAEIETVTTTIMETETQTETETVDRQAADSTLPDPVAATRAELLEAAEEGDHERLAALAGPDFSYTFGGTVQGGPVAYWRGLEAEGEQPLEALAAVLRLPYALSAGLFVWPFAHAVDPAELTEYERGLLAEIPGGAPVGDEGYLGWRTGVRPDGAWQFFIAGD